MSKFIFSGFADEISPELDVQISVLNKLGIGYMEMRGVNGKNVSDYTPEEMKEIKKTLDKGGIKVSSVGSPIGKIGVNDDFDAHMAKLRNTIEIAKILETKYIRMFSFYPEKGQDLAECRDEVMRRIKAMVEVAKENDIILLHENEKDIYGEMAKGCLDVLETINDDNLRAVFDPANFVQCKQETYPEAYNMLKDHVVYMHIKDAIEDGTVVPTGKGLGHVKEIITALHKAGYEGFLSLEPHLGNFVGFSDLEIDGTISELPDGGEKSFTIAYNAIKKIVDEVTA